MAFTFDYDFFELIFWCLCSFPGRRGGWRCAMIGQFAKIEISTLVLPLDNSFPKGGYKCCFSGVIATLSAKKCINCDSNDDNGKDCFSRKGFPPPY